MEVLRVRGAVDVARLLRNLADQIDHKAVNVDGQPIALSESLEAIVDLANERSDVSLIDVRLEHPSPAAWDLTKLQQEMAHPGG